MGTLLAGIAALVSIFSYGSSSPARGTAPGRPSQAGAAPSASRGAGPSASEDTGPASPSADPFTPTSSPPVAPTTPHKPPTPRTAQFDLVQGYGFSLNDDPLRPGQTGPQGQGFEVHWDDFLNVLVADQGAELIKDGSKSLAECREAARFEDSLNEYVLVKGGHGPRTRHLLRPQGPGAARARTGCIMR